MNKLYIIILFLFAGTTGMTQNLVPNGGFEQNTGCPTPFSPISICTSWMNPSTVGSPDYYNPCAAGTVGVPFNIYGYQQPHGGDAYTGLYITQITDNVREYLEVPLLSPLVSDSCYKFRMYVNLGNYCFYSSDAIGVYFSMSPITNVNDWFPIPVTPQISNASGNVFDTLTWKMVSGNYRATGGESYLIIGNFKTDANTLLAPGNSQTIFTPVYCYIDDVSLVRLRSCSKRDNTVQLANSDDAEEAPLIFPNPFDNELRIEAVDAEPTEFILYDMNLRVAVKENFSSTVSVNTSKLQTGIYFYEIKSADGVITKGKVIK